MYGFGPFSVSSYWNAFRITDSPVDVSEWQTVDSMTSHAHTGGLSVTISGRLGRGGSSVGISQHRDTTAAESWLSYALSFSPPASVNGHQVVMELTVYREGQPVGSVESDGHQGLSVAKDWSTARVYLIHEPDREEHFFGFGEQYSAADMKGACVPILTQEQGIGRGIQPLTLLLNMAVGGGGGSSQTTYTAIPHYISSRSNSILIEGNPFAVFDLTRHPPPPHT